MTRTTKYVALDVHQATTVASVRTETGRVIARTILPTEGPPLREFFRGIRGPVQVAFEEGTQAQWLHDLLVPLVHQVVVCDRHGERRFRSDAEALGAWRSARNVPWPVGERQERTTEGDSVRPAA
jgi:hypothetical protein